MSAHLCRIHFIKKWKSSLLEAAENTQTKTRSKQTFRLAGGVCGGSRAADHDSFSNSPLAHLPMISREDQTKRMAGVSLQNVKPPHVKLDQHILSLLLSWFHEVKVRNQMEETTPDNTELEEMKLKSSCKGLLAGPKSTKALPPWAMEEETFRLLHHWNRVSREALQSKIWSHLHVHQSSVLRVCEHLWKWQASRRTTSPTHCIHPAHSQSQNNPTISSK